MNTYVLTHARIDGTITVGYNSKGILVNWSLEALFDEKTYDWLISHLPTEESNVNVYRSKGFKAKKVPQDLSLEAFLTRYGKRDAKIKAGRAWKRLSESDQTLVMESVPAYLRDIAKTGTKQMYPASYINSERYRDYV